VPWAPGAFLSVSTFFTLSGFLITALLLGEERRTNRVDLRAFWGRRLRRLMPAALVAITSIVALSAVLADQAQLDGLRGEALSALFYVANWHFIVTGASYGAIFDSPSPFAHFWTLAIEEQYYLIFPLAMAGVLRATRSTRRAVVGAVLLLGAIASAGWSAYLFHRGADLDRIYFGTDTRLGELLVGGLLAVIWVRWHHRLAGERAVRVLSVAGPVSLVAMLVLWSQAELSQTFWYQGGLTAYAVLTSLVIVAAMSANGSVRSVLSVRALVWVGIVSYGAYLFHWPILVWLHAHTSLSDVGRLGVGLGLTLVLAALSARYVEGPIRRGGDVGPVRARIAAPLAFATVLAIVLTVTTVTAPTQSLDLADSAEALERLTAEGPSDANGDDEADALRAAVAASDAPVLAIFGDSTALQTALGLVDWTYHNAEVLRPGGGWSTQGCGLVPEGERVVDGVITSPPPECADWLEGWQAEMERFDPDVAYVQLGTWEVHDTRLPDDDELVVLGEDSELDALVESRLAEAVDLLLTQVPVVVLASSPDIEIGRVDGQDPSEPAPASDPARMARFREIVASVARRHPDRVRVVDLAGYLDERPDEDRRLRPDGVHFTADTASEVAQWLGPELAGIHADVVAPDGGDEPSG
jgi:peptidoglycan/LPS O-acetylase OafA/YrhL/lysophospholipase L1-like esterase